MRVEHPHPIFMLPHHVLVRVVAPCDIHTTPIVQYNFPDMVSYFSELEKIGVSHYTQLRKNFILEIIEQTRGQDSHRKDNLLTKEMRVELPHLVFTLPRRVLVRVVAPGNLHEWDGAASKDSLL